MIYLASNSPRRTELLTQVKIDHEVIEIEIKESLNPAASAKENAENLSLQKCKEGIRHILSNKLSIFPVLAADTMVLLGSDIFGKPESKDHAISMLMQLSGQVHSVISGVTIGVFSKDQADFHSISAESFVEFGHISAFECKKYCATQEPLDKAGAYGIQGYGAAFVRGIKGSYSNIVGLPIFELIELLKKLQIPYSSDPNCN